MSPGTREFNSAGVTLSHLNAVELFRANDSDQNFRLEKNLDESSKQKLSEAYFAPWACWLCNLSSLF